MELKSIRANIFAHLAIPLAVLGMLVSAMSISAVEIEDLKVAVIWNSSIEIADANIPVGYNEGKDDRPDPREDSASTGKSALKLFLHSLDDSVGYDSANTLDISNVRSTVRDDDGVLENTKDVLSNARIYKELGGIDYSDIVADFGGVDPAAVVYINAGSEWHGDINNLKDILVEASQAGVGVMSIGSSATTEAALIDPEGDIFAVRGVQRDFTFGAYTGDVLSAFDFTGTKGVSDTVLLKYEDGTPSMTLIENVEYNVSAEEYEYDEVSKIYEYGGVNELHDEVEINHGEEEWQITATAVEVIQHDTYMPDMNIGVVHRTTWLNLDGWNEDEYQIKLSDSISNNHRPVVLNGKDVFQVGDVLDPQPKFNVVDGTAEIDEDYYITIDGQRHLFLKKGAKVSRIDGYDGGKWHRYKAGGYDTLTIDVQHKQDVLVGNSIEEHTNPELFQRIFPGLKQDAMTQLRFKPWKDNGRITANADIWAIDARKEDLIKPFSDIYDETKDFDEDSYYYAVLGNQVAFDGRDGGQHYYSEPMDGYFEKHPFKRLGSPNPEPTAGPAEADPDTDVGTEEKFYHAIGAIQKGHQRILMLGFQPQYIADFEKIIEILHDGFIWVAADNVIMPTPEITPMAANGVLLSPDNDTFLVHTDVDSLVFEVDFTQKGDEISNNPHIIEYTLSYDGVDYTGSVEEKDPENAGDLRRYSVGFDKLVDGKGNTFAIDPKNRERDIDVTAHVIPGEPKKWFQKSLEGTADLRIRQLDLPTITPGDGATIEPGETISFSHESGDLDDIDNVENIKYFLLEPDEGLLDGASYDLQGSQDRINVRAQHESGRYLHSDSVALSYDLQGNLPRPDADSGNGSVLFADDTVTLSVDLSDIDGTPGYYIEYTIEYAGADDYTDGFTAQGENDKDVSIYLDQFVDRQNRDVTKFSVSAQTIAVDDGWNNSGNRDLEYKVRKLGTNPDQPQNVDFWDDPSLTVAATYNGTEYDGDIHGEPAYIKLGADADNIDRTEESEAQFDFTETNSFSFVFWAEHSRYIHSDIVRENEFVVNNKILPAPVAAPTDDQANNRDEYHFYDPHDIRISLERDDNFNAVSEGDFVIDVSGDVSAELDKKSANDLNITMDRIDGLIDMGRGSRSLDFTGQTKPADGIDYWDSSGRVSYSYDFRTVDLTIEVVNGDADSDSLGIVFTAADPVNGEALNDARIFYTYEGHTMSADGIDTTDASTYSGSADHGQEISVPNGVILTGVGFRSGYIPNSPDDGTDIFTKDATLLISPEDKTAFGDSLDVTLQSNLSPIYYEVYGKKGTIDGTSGTVTLDQGEPNPGDSVEVPFRAWVDGDGDVIEGVEQNRLYYRRMLPDVTVDPASGDYSGEFEVEMFNSADKSQRNIFYSFSPAPAQDDNLYTAPFKVTPDIDVFARAFVNPDVVESSGAGGWLPSNTDEKNYRRVTTGVDEGSAYFDRSSGQEDLDADGVIDLAIVELSDRWDGLELPESAECIFPGTSQKRTVTENITWEDADDLENTRILIPVDFEDVQTGFPADEYITLSGSQYVNESVTVGDSVAPVIKSAGYKSGEYLLDGSRADDTLRVEFSEEVTTIREGAPDEEILFNFGALSDAYPANITYFRGSGSEYYFVVDSLFGVMYPYADDSIWINTEAAVSVSDGMLTQDIPLNRRVPLNPKKLNIKVDMDCYWMKNNPGFSSIDPETEGYSVFGSTVDGEVLNAGWGGLIIIDPKVPFTPSQSRDFDASLVILDAVGNVVASMDSMDDGTDNLDARAILYKTPDGTERYVIGVAWDGTNDAGREVHARTYKVIAKTTWPTIDDAIVVKGLMPVQK